MLTKSGDNMSKICLMLNNINEFNLKVDSILIGLKNFNSLNILELEIEEIEKLIEDKNKEIFISINKLIHNNELEELKIILKKLEGWNISGVFFDDISIYNIVKENNLNISLIWGNSHQATNYNTINSWNRLGVKNSIISPDITLEEIIDIKNNTESKVFVPIYGMFEIFSSNRFLVKNYLKYIDKNSDSKLHYINHKILDTYYPIYEDSNGTHIINGNILNGLEEMPTLIDNKVDYVLINSYIISNIEEVIDAFNEVLNGKIDNLNEVALKLSDNNKVFLYKETIYKVKSSDNDGK